MADDKPKYELTYFEGIRGRGEAIKMMLTMSGEKYDMRNVTFLEWSTGYKEKTPLGYVPLLTTEEGVLANTLAICSYIATKLGYQPESDWDRAQSESIMITADDLLTTIGREVYIYIIYKFRPVPEDIEEKKNKSREELVKKCEYFSKMAKPGAKFMFGEKMTVADIFLYTTIDYCCVIFPEARTCNEWVETWVDNMEGDEKFSDYLSNRPPTGPYGT